MKLKEAFSSIIIGDNHLSLECGNLWLEQGHTVLVIVSNFKPAKIWAKQHNVQYLQTLEDLQKWLSFSAKVDYIFSIVNTKILSEDLIEAPRFYAINYHDGLLPRYAGRHATSWAILNQEKNHGITWHIMQKNIDEGYILLQEQIPLDTFETTLSLNVKCYETARSNFSYLTQKISNKTLIPFPQDLSNRTYFSLHQKPPGNGWVNWKQPAENIAVLCHALYFGPYDNRLATAKFLFNQQLYIITKCSLCESIYHSNTTPGTLVKINPNRLRIATQTTDLEIEFTNLQHQAVIGPEQLNITLPSPEPSLFEKVKNYSEFISPFERFWVTEITKITPTDFPYPLEKNEKYLHSVELDATLLLKDTPIDRLLGIIIVYLSRLNSQSTVSLMLHSMEQQKQLLGIEPFFAINLPFTISFDTTESFHNLLQAIGEKQNKILQNHTFTNDIILRYPILADNDLSQLVTVAFVETDINYEHMAPSHNLLIIVNLKQHRIRYVYPYGTAKTTQQLSERMHKHLQTMLETVSLNPHISAGAIPILTQQEYLQLKHWNDTTTPYPEHHCLHDLFEQQVKQTPHHPAIQFEATILSYQEVNERANALAQQLVDLNLDKASIMGVYLERSLEMVIALLAILKAGGAYLPLNPDYPIERINLLVKESSINLILTTANLKSHLSVIITDTILIDNWTKTQHKTPDCLRNSQGLANIIYTSGSTGNPKGVMNTHRGLVNRICWMQNTFPLTQNDRVLQKTPFSFDVSIWEFFWPLICGATMVIARPSGHKDVYYLSHLIQTENITVTHFVPSMLQLFLQTEEAKSCKTLRYVFASGEALKKETVMLFYQHMSAQLHNLYGPTEASIDVTHWPCPQTIPVIVPIGRPIANMKIHILDHALQALPVNIAGEIYIEGPGLAQGYLHQEALTNEKYITLKNNIRVYRSGDLGKYLPDGTIQWLKRIDKQIKLRGYRIELEEIEQTLLDQHHWVNQCIVTIKEDHKDIQQLIAYVVLQPQISREISTHTIQTGLKDQMSQILPDYMIPDLIMILDSIPLTMNGKIDLTLLPKIIPYYPQDAIQNSCPIQSELRQIWSQILSVHYIGPQDSFFGLGGNSLLATQMIIQVRDHYGLSLSLIDLFNFPTLSGFAQCIQSKEKSEDKHFNPKTRPNKLPLSFAQQRLWLTDQMITNKAAYNIPLVISLQGHLAIENLRQALQLVMARHEVLRANFIANEGSPEQIVNKHPADSLEIIQINENQYTDHLIKTIVHQPFDLKKDCLFRTKLICLNEHTHILVMVFPHIVIDETSLLILLRELSHYYQDALHMLPVLPAQYIDFALWQHDEIKSARIQTQLEYWKHHLADAPRLSSFPTDKQRPELFDQTGKTYSTHITQSTVQKLRAISKEYEVTIFMTLVAALQILIYQYSKQSDIVIGTPINERKQKETENLIGCFVNVVALRTRINAEHTLETLLQDIKKTSLKAYENSDAPLQAVISHLNVNRTYNHAPLYQVMISVQSEALAIKLPDIQYDIIPAFTDTSKLDLTFYILTHHSDKFVMNIEYSTALFEASTITKIARDFVILLENFDLLLPKKIEEFVSQ